MTAYAVMYGATPADRFSAVRCADRAAARAYINRHTPHVPPEGNAGGCGYVIERAEDVTWGGALLVAVYGALAGSAPSKFESRAAGVERLMRALETHAHSPTVLAPEHTDAEQQPAQESNPPMEVTETEMPKKSVAAAPKRGRPKKSAVVHKIKSERINPGGSRARLVAFCNGTYTVPKIAKELGVDSDVVLRRLSALEKYKGIGYKIEDEKPVLIFPEGKGVDDYVHE